MTRERIGTRAGLLFALILAANAACLPRGDASDPMLEGDWFLPGRLLELLPGAPWIGPGRDARLGTADDAVLHGLVGDVDLVVRTGGVETDVEIPPPAPQRGDPPLAVAEPFGAGVPIEFTVLGANGREIVGGPPVASPAIAAVPVLAVAFGDLDGDGFVGITELDGDAADAALEKLELTPVGRRFALASASRASGQLFAAAGGPGGAELDVLVAAAAYTGPTDPGFFGGNVPTGGAVLTAFPFLPRTDPNRVIDGNRPGPASEGERVGVEIEEAFEPDPTAGYGEAFTLATDGSAESVDLARVRSGAAVRFGAARAVDAAGVAETAHVRPGLDASGARTVLELPEAVAGAASLVIVPLDRLGNVADLAAPASVSLRATGAARILAPDADGDVSTEMLSVDDARGSAIEVDAGGAGGGPSGLVIEGGGGISQLEVQGVAAE